MSTQISPQIRLVAIAGLLLAVVGGGAMLLLGRSHTPAAPAPTVPRVTTSATTPAAPVAKTPTTHATTTPTRQATKPAARTHARAQAKPVAKTATHRGNLVDSRLPAVLQWELSQHKIVVVSFYDPQAEVDAISVAEAHQGAVDAKVGFLLVNVLDNAVAGPLTGLLPGGGLLPNPGVLVYRAPGRIVYRFDGFADRETIAQAAADAAAGVTAASVVDPGLATSATGATP